MSVQLSPNEAKIVAALGVLRESWGLKISNESKVELGTTYALLGKLEKEKILSSRTEESRQNGRLVVRRLYKLAPNIPLPSNSFEDTSLRPA
jgi:hypothetical protein